LIELAKRSGAIKSITAELVQEGDDFIVEFGTNPQFVHRPKFQGDGNGDKYVYALAMFEDGHFEYTVLSKDDVEHIRRKSSKAPDSPAWKNYPGEMAKKCAIRRLCKTLPLTVEAMEGVFMARPEKDSCDFFFTNSKLFYDTKIKALRRSFKDSGNANNAFFVFDYLFREIFGNEGYYIEYSEDLVGDTADFCYLPESFVSDVIKKCVDIGLFHQGQFEENNILTSRAIQKKYESITARRAKQKIESRFCVLNEELLHIKTELMRAETELMSAESTHSKRIEKESKEKGEGDACARESPPTPTEVQHHFSVFLAAWDALANDESAPVKAVKRNWNFPTPPIIATNYLARCQEYGEETVLDAIDRLRTAKYLHKGTGKVGLSQLLEERFFLKLLEGGYDEIFAKPDGGKPKPDKSKGCAPVHEDDQRKFDAWNTTH